jgi:hypothetical protein
VVLRLYTAASNGPIVCLQVTYAHGESWLNDINRAELLICPPELSGNSIPQTHLVASGKKGDGNDEFVLGKYSCDTGPMAFLLLRKKAFCQILSSLKIHHLVRV